MPSKKRRILYVFISQQMNDQVIAEMNNLTC